MNIRDAFITGIGQSEVGVRLTRHPLLLTVDAVDGKKLNVRSEPSRGKDGPAKRPIDGGAKGKTKEIAAAAGSQYVAYIDGDQSVSVRK